MTGALTHQSLHKTRIKPPLLLCSQKPSHHHISNPLSCRASLSPTTTESPHLHHFLEPFTSPPPLTSSANHHLPSQFLSLFLRSKCAAPPPIFFNILGPSHLIPSPRCSHCVFNIYNLLVTLFRGLSIRRVHLPDFIYLLCRFLFQVDSH